MVQIKVFLIIVAAAFVASRIALIVALLKLREFQEDNYADY